MEKIIKLDKKKGLPKVEVFTGRQHEGRYHLHLWNKSGSNLIWEQRGINTDHDPDVYQIGEKNTTKVNDLDGRSLDWTIVVVAQDPQPGEQFFTSIEIRQGGIRVPNGFDERHGPISNAPELFIGSYRFEVV